MQDLNLFSRANFEDTTLQLTCTAKPGQSGKAFISFSPDQVFCVQEVSWKYSVETAGDDPYGWPKFPVKVTILGITENRVEAPVKVSPPKLLTDSLQVEIQNPASLVVTVHFTIKGILATSKNNGSVSTTEILGYALLDNNQRGMLALSGAHNSRQLGAEGAFLTESQTHKTLAMKQPLALEDEQSLNSLMIGDLVTYQPSQPEFALKLEQIRDLAKYLINKKWAR
jgi:hypothetical protein